MSQTMVSVSIVILLYVPAALIFNLTFFERAVQFENYLMLNGDITVVMRMGWQPLCLANEIILSAQIGTLELQESTCANRPTHSAIGGDLAPSFC